MSDVSDRLAQALTTVFTLFTLMSIVVGAVVYARGSYNKAHLQELREANEDLRARMKDVEDENERRRMKEDTLNVEIDHLKEENLLLANMITQRANVEALLDVMENHHAEALRAWAELKSAIERLSGDDVKAIDGR